MKVNIESAFQLSDLDRKVIEGKIEDLKKYESRMTHVNVFFKKDDGNEAGAVLAEIAIRVPGKDIFSSDDNLEAMKAFANAYSAAKRQVKKRRDKLNDHHSDVRQINEIVNNTY